MDDHECETSHIDRPQLIIRPMNFMRELLFRNGLTVTGCVKAFLLYRPRALHVPSPKTFMSAFPRKADMCGATKNVRYGPIADVAL